MPRYVGARKARPRRAAREAAGTNARLDTSTVTRSTEPAVLRDLRYAADSVTQRMIGWRGRRSLPQDGKTADRVTERASHKDVGQKVRG